ncbi:MAG: hypothetical protein AB7O57_17885, partial [Hyphomicrobiaceae bacterium]
MTSLPRNRRSALPRVIAVVPVKALSLAKQRLGAAILPERRRALVLAMLNDVLGTLAQVPAIERVIVVSRDAEVATTAAQHGARIVEEPPAADMNAAIAFGLAAAAAEGAERGLVL